MKWIAKTMLLILLAWLPFAGDAAAVVRAIAAHQQMYDRANRMVQMHDSVSQIRRTDTLSAISTALQGKSSEDSSQGCMLGAVCQLSVQLPISIDLPAIIFSGKSIYHPRPTVSSTPFIPQQPQHPPIASASDAFSVHFPA